MGHVLFHYSTAAKILIMYELSLMCWSFHCLYYCGVFTNRGDGSDGISYDVVIGFVSAEKNLSRRAVLAAHC